MKYLICLVTILLTSCAAQGTADSSSSDKSTKNETTSAIKETAATVKADQTNGSSQSRAVEASQSEVHKYDSTSHGISGSEVTFTRENIDPVSGKVLSKDTINLKSSSDTNASKSTADNRDLGGKYSGSTTSNQAKTELSTNSNTSVEASNIADKMDKKESDKLQAKSSVGFLDFWWWLFLVVILVMVVAFLIYRNSLVGRLSRLMNVVSSLEYKPTDQDKVQTLLTSKDLAALEVHNA